MNLHRPGRWWWPCAIALLAVACTSPQPRYYVLESLRASDAPATRVSVFVEPVTVPAEVDRPQIVRATKSNEVSIEDLHRWASPLQDNVAEVLASDLSAYVSGSIVMVDGGYRAV